MEVTEKNLARWRPFVYVPRKVRDFLLPQPIRLESVSWIVRWNYYLLQTIVFGYEMND